MLIEKFIFYLNFCVQRDGYSLRIIYISVILLGLTMEFLSLFSNISLESFNLLLFPVLFSKKNLYQMGKIFMVLLGFITLLIPFIFLGNPAHVIFLIIYLCVICISLYFGLYSWRKLPFSFFSFICFSINFFIFCSFMFGLINLIIGLPKPIYIEDLSQYSYYKYIVFIIIFIMVGIGYLVICHFFPYILKTSYYKALRVPYLKENIISLLETWKDSFFDDFHYKLSKNMHRSKYSNYVSKAYLSFVFLFIYLIRLVQVIVFCNFVFFHGDLRWNLYLLPFSFLSWCLASFEQYFRLYVEESFNYCNLLVNVISTEPNLVGQTSLGFTLVDSSKLSFGLTEFGYNSGYRDQDLPIITNAWLQASHSFCLLKVYAARLFYFNICIIFLRSLSWLVLAGIYILGLDSDVLFVTSLIVRVSPNYTKLMFCTRAHMVRKGCEAYVAAQTDNVYSAPHLIGVDTEIRNEKNQVKVEGAFTHGPGTPENPSVPLHPSKDFKGPNTRGQRYIPVTTPTFIPDHMISSPIAGSEQLLKEAECKVNMAKVDHGHKAEEYP